MKAKCSRCGRFITLVHKTKKAPNGSMLHSHKDGLRNCYGSPTETTKETFQGKHGIKIDHMVIGPDKPKSRREEHLDMVKATPDKYLIDCFKCSGTGTRLSSAVWPKPVTCSQCFGTGKLKNGLAEWSDIIAKVPLTWTASTAIELPNGRLVEPPRFTEDELAYIRESVYLRPKLAVRKSILAKIPVSLSRSK